jgi:hypothetical protein
MPLNLFSPTTKSSPDSTAALAARVTKLEQTTAPDLSSYATTEAVTTAIAKIPTFDKASFDALVADEALDDAAFTKLKEAFEAVKPFDDTALKASIKAVNDDLTKAIADVPTFDDAALKASIKTVKDDLTTTIAAIPTFDDTALKTGIKALEDSAVSAISRIKAVEDRPQLVVSSDPPDDRKFGLWVQGTKDADSATLRLWGDVAPDEAMAIVRTEAVPKPLTATLSGGVILTYETKRNAAGGINFKADFPVGAIVSYSFEAKDAAGVTQGTGGSTVESFAGSFMQNPLLDDTMKSVVWTFAYADGKTETFTQAIL